MGVVFKEAERTFELGNGKTGRYFSLPYLEEHDFGRISRLPVSIRIVLESLLRNCDETRVRMADVRALAAWKPNEERTAEIPFVVGRVLLQDFTGVPLLVDMAAMRSAVDRLANKAVRVEPIVPVDLVIDHSVQVDYFGRPDAFEQNLAMEFDRNLPRYQFLKWGTQAFETFKIVPPGIGICHQVNLEYLAKGVIATAEDPAVYHPDTLVGTDSHTTMINGLGIVAWGVGGIEAEAAMLGQPVYFLTPDVVGVRLEGQLAEGVTATDLVLALTELLRKAKVVGKFVEFHGAGAAALPAAERATIANMAPEYGATMGFFPVDEETCRYFLATGRSTQQVDAIRNYFKAQGLFGIPEGGQCDYSQVVEFDLGSVEPAVAGPRRPQDRIALSAVKRKFEELLAAAPPDGYGRPAADRGARHPIHDNGCPIPARTGGGGAQDSDKVPMGRHALESTTGTATLTEREMMNNRPTPDAVSGGDAEISARHLDVGHGDVLIAAITSCTNTSNPAVMIAAGLVAKKAVERGLRPRPTVKTSLAPGSRVVTEYLEKTGLQAYLDQIGFATVGYGCTTCIGNSGPLDTHIEEAIGKYDIVGAAVLSGNRNFEARVHQNIKANFLMSPPLVVAYALAGSVDRDLTREPVGRDTQGKDVYLVDLWPTLGEIRELLGQANDPQTYRRLYSDLASQNPMWTRIDSPTGTVYRWDDQSTYIQEPPYFDGFSMDLPARPAIRGARALAVFGDSITTDHISPAGAIKATSPAGRYLQERGTLPADFNSYGSRRGNHEVMVRGTFANVRIKNLMVPGVEGGVTVHHPGAEQLSIYDAAMRYEADNVPLMVFAGLEYGTGSSRDWAAKGTRLLGVRAVVARSFERIHRSNLVGMGVLPCQFKEGTTPESLGLEGDETFDLEGLEGEIRPRQDVTLAIHRAGGRTDSVPVTLRIDTPIEVEYYRHGGILPYVLRQLVSRS